MDHTVLDSNVDSHVIDYEDTDPGVMESTGFTVPTVDLGVITSNKCTHLDLLSQIKNIPLAKSFIL